MSEGKESSPAVENGGRGAQERLLAGRFRLLRLLGQGGMGKVWLAADATLGRFVAVKELRPVDAVADLRTLQLRALREARSAAVITHPNAVTLYEVLSVPGDDAVYLIMEYVEGPTLAGLIGRDGPLPAPTVAHYGLQLLDVLATAHALGIVHRDVKPGNILIAAGDQAKLADFGIAYNVSDTRLTTSGVIGTRAYMAPELFDNKPITPAADLWSLGATLYHAAQGQGAFDREGSGPMLRAILLDDIPVPRCEPHLAEAISGLLRRDLRERATVEETRETLRQVLAQRTGPVGRPALEAEPWLVSPGAGPTAEPPADRNWDSGGVTDLYRSPGLTTPPVPPPADKRPPLRRLGRRSVSVAAAILVLAAAGAVGGILATNLDTGHSSAAALSATPTVTRGHGASAAATNPSPRVSTRASGSPGVPGTRAPASGPAVPGTPTGGLKLSKTLRGPAGVAQTGIAYSPDGSLLATYGTDDGSEAILWNPSTGARTFLPFGAGAPDVAFSHDSTRVAVAERFGGVGLWSVASHSAISNVNDDHFATGVAFSPKDDNTLAVGDSDGVRLLNLTTRAFGAPLTGSAGVAGPWTVLFSPNGNTLAAVDRDTGYVYVWDAGTRALDGTIPPPAAGDVPGKGTSISYSPDSGLLAISHYRPTKTSPGIEFLAVRKRAVVSHMEYPGVQDVNGLAYDPAATDSYAVVGTNGHVVLWELPAGRKLGDVANPGGVPLVDVAFSPSGNTIATLDAKDRIHVYTVE